MTGLLQDHIAAVTGAGSGIGRAIALGYAREGARVVVLDLNGEGARPRPCSRSSRPARRRPTRSTSRDRAACRVMATKVAGRKLGNIFDPGEQCRHKPPQRLSRAIGDAVVKDWEDIIAINLNGVFNVTHAFVEQLRATKGRIVNIGSIQSFMHVRTPATRPPTPASKHGVLGFTRALAAELGKDGVRVNAIGPGLIETPLNAAVRA